MKLDHINLTVHDVIEAGNFLKKHFNFADVFDNNDASITALKEPSGMIVLLMKGSVATYPKMFHIGFDLETKEAVNAHYERLTSAGIVTDPPESGWGSWTFNFKCPGGNFTIEVACPDY
ncbi:VOC family protein [bacterium]|nr:VOC family protein [bacterium]